MTTKPKKDYRYYLPIVLILIGGYCSGGILTFCVEYLNWYPYITAKLGRLTLELFGMGIFGSTIYVTRWWAIDMDQSVDDETLLPHLFDTFGYATTIVGGGIMGVVFYLAVRAGAVVAFNSTEGPQFRTSAALLIAFVGGLFEFKIQLLLEKLLKKVVNTEESQKIKGS